MNDLIFETERLLCRPFQYSDAQDMLKNWVSDPDIQNEYGEPVYSELDDVIHLLNSYINQESDKSHFHWAIIEKQSGLNIGQIAFCKLWNDLSTAEIEYCIGKEFWGKGYATEALAALIKSTFIHTSIIRLEAYHRIENTKSGRVLEKSVMHKTDNIQRFVQEGISPDGEICYCIEKAEFINKYL